MEPLTTGDPQTVGDFRLRARLGAGGMGRVYLATSLAGRFIAVKVIHPELSDDPDFARRFRGEADAAQRVSGLYTAPVVATGIDDRPPWLATAFVPGPSLESIVSQYGPLPLPALWRLGAGLAEALRAIHSAGLVHRDLKPPNVILASDGPRVIDFGIARAVADDRLTATGSVIGTPTYMSPEQVEGHEAGPPTDVFALGCVLGFAASGRSPFDGGPGASAASAMYRVARTEPDLAAIPPEARGLIAACLAKDPARRPDPGQVAAQCATVGGSAGVSPTAFWPEVVAAVIRSQQAVVNAQVEALVSQPPGTQLASQPGPVMHPATQLAGFHPPTELAAPPAMPPIAGMPGMATATIGPGAKAGQAYPGAPVAPNSPWAPGVPGTPGAPWTPSQPQPYPGRPAPARQGTSRRSVLIGAGLGAVAAIGGATAWVLSAGSGPAKPGTVVWTFSTGSQAVDANPTVAAGVAYVGGSNDELYAVKAATGQELWTQSVSKVSAAPTVAGGLVFTSSEQGDFSVFHAASGSLAWAVSGNSLDPFKKDFATIAGKRAALAAGNGITMYNAAGQQIWSVNTSVDSGFGQIVAMAGSVVYGFTQLGTLVALDAANGKQTGVLGKLLSSDGNGTNVIISDGIMYFGADEGPLYALDAESGHVKWTYKPGSGAFPQSDPVVAGGIVYFADNNGLIHAVSAPDGKRVWTYPTGGQDLTGPGAGGGHVYVLTHSSLQQLDAKTGKPGWTFTLSTQVPFSSTPTVAGDLVLCGNSDGNLYAIKA